MDGTIEDLIVGRSAAVRDLRSRIAEVAPYNVSVIASGPTGAGKELVARGLHKLSGRRGRLVVVNCAAIPQDLLEAELFGHEKGAFTGADRRRPGQIEEAEGGTLFLDEVADMPLGLQAKLLRALEGRSVRRVGSGEEIAVDFRLICASHQRLEDNVRAGTFREDLLYRISVFPIHVPALRERLEDLPDLVAKLSERIAGSGCGLIPARFGDRAILALARHDWPGNIRELRNVLERAAVMFGGREIGEDEVARLIAPRPERQQEQMSLWDGIAQLSQIMAAERPEAVAEPVGGGDAIENCFDSPGFDLRSHVQSLEVRFIEAALRRSGGNRAEAADVLGLRRTTLLEKMKKYGLGTG